MENNPERPLTPLGGEPKSLIITDSAVYISPISPQTVKRRAEMGIFEAADED
jgi:hypothetical protein